MWERRTWPYLLGSHLPASAPHPPQGFHSGVSRAFLRVLGSVFSDAHPSPVGSVSVAPSQYFVGAVLRYWFDLPVPWEDSQPEPWVDRTASSEWLCSHSLCTAEPVSAGKWQPEPALSEGRALELTARPLCRAPVRAGSRRVCLCWGMVRGRVSSLLIAEGTSHLTGLFH